MTPGEYLELSLYWEDIVDLLEGADRARDVMRRRSAGCEIACVGMTRAGNGDRLPPAADRNRRKQLCAARVNQNHFVPLAPMGHARS
eukprot:564723-Pyramimonas_sp.AAC.1